MLATYSTDAILPCTLGYLQVDLIDNESISVVSSASPDKERPISKKITNHGDQSSSSPFAPSLPSLSTLL